MCVRWANSPSLEAGRSRARTLSAWMSLLSLASVFPVFHKIGGRFRGATPKLSRINWITSDKR